MLAIRIDPVFHFVIKRRTSEPMPTTLVTSTFSDSLSVSSSAGMLDRRPWVSPYSDSAGARNRPPGTTNFCLS